MIKKYELVHGDTRRVNGKRLTRIRSLIQVRRSVAPGALGGYVESGHNLSHEGESWIFDNACVFDRARVTDDAFVAMTARVSGKALVTNSVCVSGNARVSDRAILRGSAIVDGDAKVFDNAELSDFVQVRDRAVVHGHACIFDKAGIYDSANVSGYALIYGSVYVAGKAEIRGRLDIGGECVIKGHAAIESYNDYLFLGPAKSSGRFSTAHRDRKIGVRVNVGCFTGSIREFSKEIEKKHSGCTKHLEQYRLFCQLIALNFGVNG